MRLVMLISFLYVCLSGFTQKNQTNDKHGEYKRTFKVIEALSGNPIDKVCLFSENGDTIGITDEKGKVRVSYPEKLKHIKTYHPDFISYNPEILLRPGPYKIISLKPKSMEYYRKHGSLKHNYLGMAVNEIFAGSIGIKYTYKLNVKNAIGSKISIYNSSINLWESRYSKYDGVKLSFLYQLYLRENRFKGMFLEPKIFFGYFDSDFISYTYYQDEATHQTAKYNNNFFTVGAGVSLGFNAYVSKTVVFTFVFGFQLLPCNMPSNISVDGNIYGRHHYGIYDYLENFGDWNTVGPGSYIELKLLLGLKFLIQIKQQIL